MSVKISSDGGLLLASGRIVRFDRPVFEALEVGDLVIVVLDSGSEDRVTRNVYGVAADGEVRWQVAPFDFPHGPTPYTGVYIHDGLTFLYNRCGVECRIDSRTGAILSTELIK